VAAPRLGDRVSHAFPPPRIHWSSHHRGPPPSPLSPSSAFQSRWAQLQLPPVQNRSYLRVYLPSGSYRFACLYSLSSMPYSISCLVFCFLTRRDVSRYEQKGSTTSLHTRESKREGVRTDNHYSFLLAAVSSNCGLS
jgi:hypothetical protein